MKKTIKLLGFIALAAVIGFSTIACPIDDSNNDNNSNGGGQSKRPIVRLSDQRFNGAFYSHGPDNKFVAYTFNGTNKGDIAINDYYYIYDIQIYDMEWEVSNGRFRARNWSDNINVNNPWDEWTNYSFSSDGKTLTLPFQGYNFTYTKN